MSSLYGIPSCKRLIRRVRQPRSQTEMADGASRRRSLRSAFTVQDCAKLGTFKRVAIVDDVMTTGATVDALAQSIKEHGVAQVDV
ncbi:MAG: phosphoribosyltransferase family protein [Pseudomonadota bacterium]|nr:phosphoribosyltransferase family protein [Pseudomonadota bacterium]MEC8357343.1 phosphoribosyltransferase family protein [Pseudomonadota bacterium]